MFFKLKIQTDSVNMAKAIKMGGNSSEVRLMQFQMI